MTQFCKHPLFQIIKTFFHCYIKHLIWLLMLLNRFYSFHITLYVIFCECIFNRDFSRRSKTFLGPSLYFKRLRRIVARVGAHTLDYRKLYKRCYETLKVTSFHFCYQLPFTVYGNIDWIFSRFTLKKTILVHLL